jgi:hypothetical protein
MNSLVLSCSVVSLIRVCLVVSWAINAEADFGLRQIGGPVAGRERTGRAARDTSHTRGGGVRRLVTARRRVGQDARSDRAE